MIRTAVSTVGSVLQVKSEFATGSALKACRARVELDLSHYCYSCGRLGHYTDSCPFIPFEEKMTTDADKTPETPPMAVHSLPLLLPPIPVTHSSPQESTPIEPQTRNDSSSITPPVHHTLTTALIPAIEKQESIPDFMMTLAC